MAKTESQTAGVESKKERAEAAGPVIRTLIGAYLFSVGLISAVLLVICFPDIRTVALPPGEVGPRGTTASDGSERETTDGRASTRGTIDLAFPAIAIPMREKPLQLTPERGLIVLAALAGILGSFLHAAQSFAIYVGNREMTRSWAWWYVLRAPIGAVLGIMFYFVVRAGLLAASSETVSPYGVIAFGALAGWFSKQATDKMAEVFETLFRAQKPEQYKDKLGSGALAPTIAEVTLEPVQGTGDLLLTIRGTNFKSGATVLLDGVELKAEVKDESELTATLPADKRPAAGDRKRLTVRNPAPDPVPSKPYDVKIP
jgi:hypothetical protein